MFKKNADSSKEYDDVQTIIGPSIEVRGDFDGEGDVVVEGKLSGTLKTKRDLRVGPAAIIEASVEAENVFIAGEVRGNIKARETIELAESSRMFGDMETKTLMIEKGAIFNGSCVMTSGEEVKKMGQTSNSSLRNKEKGGRKKDGEQMLPQGGEEEKEAIEEIYGDRDTAS